MRVFLALFLLLATTATAVAQKSPKQLSEKFLSSMSKNPGEAMAALYYHNPDYMDLNAEDYEQKQAKVIEEVGHLGEPAGYELLSEAKRGTSLLKLTYIAKFHRSPAVASFTWYNVNEKWIMLDMKLDSRPLAIQHLFEQQDGASK